MKTIRYALQGAIALLFISLSTVILAVSMAVLAIFKRLAPPGVMANAINRSLSSLGEFWVSGNNFVLRRYRGMKWNVHLPENLDHGGRYLVLCNHQSWVDILAMQYALNRQVPFLRFMLKQQLIWIPFLGLAWWSLDFPFLRRYSRQELQKNPELRDKDLENAARACEKLKHIPVSMMSFPEGTRFTRRKHDKQKSPYQHLLLPRYGGIGQVLYSFGDALQSVIDMTISYPGGTPTFWQFISGQVQEIRIHAYLRQLDPQLLGVNFRGDEAARIRLKNWLDGIWAEKDLKLSQAGI
ncbi:MAG TPA: acyltransferase [Xanthomonadales bacterium]|nr:acyltransferase [Xanthomonadales bacterium]